MKAGHVEPGLWSISVPADSMPGIGRGHGTYLLYEETPHALDCGDYLVLFSDGVTDARDEADEEFGEERLFEILRASVGEPGRTLIDRVFTACRCPLQVGHVERPRASTAIPPAIDAFAGGAPQFDDITMLVARRLPVGGAPGIGATTGPPGA